MTGGGDPCGQPAGHEHRRDVSLGVVALARRPRSRSGRDPANRHADRLARAAHVARLRPGERVLIYTAAGGVGQAAVQIALARGAEVFATAGTADKRSMLRVQGVLHVANSRDRSFVAVVRDATANFGPS